MSILFRHGTIADLNELKELAVTSWKQFQPALTAENWQRLYNNLTTDATYTELLEKSHSFVATAHKNDIIGMAFLVPSGNPTDIYDKDWCYIRLITVHPSYGGQGIGKQLTSLCIETAKQHNENAIALHTSELMDAARHIYESLGFRVLKEIDQRLGKRYWLYKLDLTEIPEEAV